MCVDKVSRSIPAAPDRGDEPRCGVVTPAFYMVYLAANFICGDLAAEVEPALRRRRSIIGVIHNVGSLTTSDKMYTGKSRKS